MKAPALLDSLILAIRGQKVLLDADLAAICGVPTKRLAEIDKTLLSHDKALLGLSRQIQPLLAPPPEPAERTCPAR